MPPAPKILTTLGKLRSSPSSAADDVGPSAAKARGPWTHAQAANSERQATGTKEVRTRIRLLPLLGVQHVEECVIGVAVPHQNLGWEVDAIDSVDIADADLAWIGVFHQRGIESSKGPAGHIEVPACLHAAERRKALFALG